MTNGEKRYKIKSVEKFNKDISQAKTDIIMSSIFAGLYAMLAAGSFLLTNSPELYEAGMIIGTGTSLVSTGYIALLVKKIRDKSLLEKNIENESSRKKR